MTPIGAIKQAFVRALRNISALHTAVGSKGIDEGISLVGATYPRVIYTVQAQGQSRNFGSDGILITTIDAYAVSDDQVEAHNLDALMLAGLENISLDFSSLGLSPEPTTLMCRRIQSLSLVDVDESSNKVYRVGGVYQIWTAPL